VTLADGTKYSSRAIIIATGVRRRKLIVPGEEELRGRGILESGLTAKNEVSGKTVLIIGGGDAALENALILSETAHKILVVHRGREFRSRTEFVQKARDAQKIEFCLDTQITNIIGTEAVESVELKHLISGEITRVEVDAVLIRIGVEPNTELFRGQIELDEPGYVIIDSNCATSLSGIFAAGDVVNRTAPTISAAVGHGALAVKHIHRKINFHNAQT
ncbi:MAG: NAD(P)/FAD-dependent oxidoreductase, partial [Pyrinomonadaceae bacterium]